MSNERKVIEVDFKSGKKVKEVVASPSAGDFTDKLLFFQSLIADKVVQTWASLSDPEVEIPNAFRKGQTLALNWSHKFGLPDFDYDEDGVRGTLSFKGNNHFVSIPWRSVTLIGDIDDPKSAMRWEVVKRAEDERSPPVLGPDLRTRVRKTVLRGLKKFFKLSS